MSFTNYGAFAHHIWGPNESVPRVYPATPKAGGGGGG